MAIEILFSHYEQNWEVKSLGCHLWQYVYNTTCDKLSVTCGTSMGFSLHLFDFLLQKLSDCHDITGMILKLFFFKQYGYHDYAFCF